MTSDTFNSPEHQWASIMPPIPNNLREPYVLPIDTTGHMFKQVMGLKELKPMEADPHSKGQVVAFDQRPFVDMALVPDKNFTVSGFKDEGFLYVPNECKHKQCDLHVALHGFNGAGPVFMEQYGNLMNYAASNEFIILYPQGTKCWNVAQLGDDLNPKIMNYENVMTNKGI